jgi:Cytidylate kinase-like family
VTARTVVCISHASGAGGEEVGRLVADRLGFLYVDEEIVLHAAARAGVDPESVAVEEERVPTFARMLGYLAEGGYPTGVVPGQPGEASSELVRTFIRDAIQEIAERGDAVIVAHAASYALAGRSGPLRVLITAPREARAAQLAASDGLEGREAARAVKRSDAGRADYLKRFYGVAQELPIHYDLVVNTESLSVDEAAALIAQAVAGRPAETATPAAT